MSGLLDLVTQALGGDATRQISQQLGVDERAASTAVAGALPVLVGALARNASSGDGAGSLAAALDRDHDGSILDDLGGFLGNSGAAATTGSGILRHVLGGRQRQVETGLGQASGLSASQAGQVMAILAPIVMAALGRAKRQERLDPGGLGTMLGQERARVERRDPRAASVLGGLLDRDGDGQVADDLAQIGGSLLSSFLRRR